MIGVPLSTIGQIRKYAERDVRRVALGDLIHHKRRMLKLGESAAFVNIARWMQDEFPVRHAHQLMEYYRLPYMMLMCPPLAEVHNRQLSRFNALAGVKKINSGEDVDAFAETLRSEFTSGTDTIQLLRIGIAELRKHINVEDMQPLQRFLDKFVVTRIGNRVLAENFVNWLDCVHEGNSDLTLGPGTIQECTVAPLIRGEVDAVCNLAATIYGSSPEVQVDDASDTEVLIIPSHLQFITREILKNTIYATMKSQDSWSDWYPPPVHIAIRPGKYDVMIKISDQGGGMRRRDLRKVWEYGFSGDKGDDLSMPAEDDESDLPKLGGYGVGVPLSRLFARYFGGDLSYSSMYGYGTDVEIRLNRIGDMVELGSSPDEHDEDRDHRYKEGSKSNRKANTFD